jgi:hypothetical protein
MMIHEALNVIQHKLLDNTGNCCAYNTKMSNSATIAFHALFFFPQTWFGSRKEWSIAVHRDTFQGLVPALQEQIAAVNKKNETALHNMFVQLV